MNVIEKILWGCIFFLFGYYIGTINLSSLIGKKIYKKDICNYGSGNPGTTNFIRVFKNKKIASFVFIFDVFKSVLSSLICLLVLKTFSSNNFYKSEHYLILFSAIGGFIGHCYPFYKKGGKGVACFFGSLLLINLYSFLLMIIL